MAHEAEGVFEICGGLKLKGSETVMAAYLSATKDVRLWGPTNFAPIIRKVADEAKELKEVLFC
jgi:hypothetical protein